MKSLFKPETLDDFFEATGVDEELRPKYRKWLINIFMRKIPSEKVFATYQLKASQYDETTDEMKRGYNKALNEIKKVFALSDMSDRIKKI